MLKNRKHVFWQAFFVTILIFVLGLVFGVYLEQIRADEINGAYYQSESSLLDTIALMSLLESGDLSCSEIIDAHVLFADKIYFEAKLLEKFDEASKITDSMKLIHRKYDLLRTILWMNVIETRETCGEVNSVVYFYEYGSEDVGMKAKQKVWERILFDLKEKYGENVLLIPVAVDNDISSLDLLMGVYDVETFPSVLINEEYLITDLFSVEELEKYIETSSFE